MTTYQSVLQEIFSLSKGEGINPSLSNIKKLCEIYNHPELSFPTVHVAGTNGKGSVCTKIATALQKEGYKTGLYTSPHIATFRERIQVDGANISEEEMAALFCEARPLFSHLSPTPTFFEITTLLAFLYFQRKGVEIAVIETGLGGRWDATNVVCPLVSVITAIGYDHTDLLGSSLESIAREKAGIFKEGVPAVIGPDVPYPLLREMAEEKKCPLYQNCLRAASYEEENQQTARLALTVLAPYFPVSKASIEAGLKKKPPCRFERHVKGKEIILDVAHNVHAFPRLMQRLSETYPNHRYRFLVGFSRDKDISSCARWIEEKSFAIHLVSGVHPRLARLSELQKSFSSSKTQLENSVAEGIAHALAAPSDSSEVIVITGSFFIMREARKALGIEEPEDPHLWYDPVKKERDALAE